MTRRVKKASRKPAAKAAKQAGKPARPKPAATPKRRKASTKPAPAPIAAPMGQRPAGLPALTISFSAAARARITLQDDTGVSAFSSTKKALAGLQKLPRRIDDDAEIAALAEAYTGYFRKVRRDMANSDGSTANELLARLQGVSGFRNLRLSATDPSSGEAVNLPWELLLHQQARGERGRELVRRTSVERTFAAAPGYAPWKVSGKLRTLVLQGPNENDIAFKSERAFILSTWRDLDSGFAAQVDRPRIETPDAEAIGDVLREAEPHLIWFSCHGRENKGSIELRLKSRGAPAWVPVAAIAEQVKSWDRPADAPLFLALWSCETNIRPHGPIFTGGDKDHLPETARACLEAGANAVLTIQTQIYDRTARVMSDAFYRGLASGHGPGLALASARSELMGIVGAEAGAASEWVSPVIWTGSARIEHLSWDRPREADDHVSLARLGRLMRARLSPASGPTSAIAPDRLIPLGGKPVWLTSPDTQHAEVRSRVLASLNARARERTYIIIEYREHLHRHDLPLAAADAMKAIRDEMFPALPDPSADFIASLFARFSSETLRDSAWRALTSRADIGVVVFAPQGLGDAAGLAELLARTNDVMIVAPNTPTSGLPQGWQMDELSETPHPAISSDPLLRAMLLTLAVLDRPLSTAALARLAADFRASADDIPAGAMFTIDTLFGLRASYIASLLAGAPPDQVRAANRAALAYLRRDGHDLPGAGEADLLALQCRHAIGAEEIEMALGLASRAILLNEESGHPQASLVIERLLGALAQRLPLLARFSLAWAQTQSGRAQQGYRTLRSIIIPEGETVLALRKALLEAEFLRNRGDTNDHELALELLETASRLPPPAEPAERGRFEFQQVVIRHDHARNRLFFRRDARGAEKAFKDIIRTHAGQPGYARLVAAACRNLADVYRRYGYGVIPENLDAARTYLQQGLAEIEKGEASDLAVDIQFELAKIAWREADKADAIGLLEASLAAARIAGKALHIGLALNKLFWWKRDPIGLNMFDFEEWRDATEILSRFAPAHLWAARSLIDSQIMAARLLQQQGRLADTRALLEEAWTIIQDADALGGADDFGARTGPVLAGLATLDEAQAGARSEHWRELLKRAKDLGVTLTTKVPRTLWEGRA